MDAGPEPEVERLRARVAELEAELAEQARHTNAVVAATQERTYWLDRWGLDLNALMRRRGAAEVRAGLRGVRGVGRLAHRVRRRVQRAP